MKKIEGANFSVRFFRRGVVKSAAKTETPQDMGETVKDIPEQSVPEPAKVFVPAHAAKEKILRDAAQAGDCYVIRTLVMEGVDLDARDNLGRTALNIATQYNQQGAIKTLLAAKEMRRLAQSGALPDTGFFRKFQPVKTSKNK